MKRKMTYRYKQPVKGRYIFVFAFFTTCFIFLIMRLGYIQLFRHNFYNNIADNNRNVMIVLPAKRGLILDRNLKELVVNVPKDSLYAAPLYIDDKEKTAEVLAKILDEDSKAILEKISNEKLFVWLARKLDDSTVQEIKSKALTGIDFVKENERSYPDESLACHLMGFVDIDNNGLEGIEKYYDKELKGKEGYKISVVDARRRQVGLMDDSLLPPRDGYNVVLALDEMIGHIVENALLEGVKKFNPKSASVVVMDCSNGDILAICNWPSYDINKYADSSLEERRNRAITDVLEPGSSFKIVTASAVLEERVVSPDEEFDCENGSYEIAGRILHDNRPHGVLKFKNIIEVSSNIGTVKVAQKLGAERLYRYIRKFGFGSETGIDLPGEVKGIVRDLAAWTKSSMCAIPIGQEVASTAVQLAQAIACIANDGILVRPRVVKKLIDNQGEIIKEFEPKLVRRVMSKETCEEVKNMLCMVVKSGTGQLASVPGYSVAGKTGTAQRLESDGSYSHTKYNSIFLGFAPVNEPKLAVAVVFVEPRPYHYGATVAAPVFSEIAGKSLRYMGVTPDL